MRTITFKQMKWKWNKKKQGRTLKGKEEKGMEKGDRGKQIEIKNEANKYQRKINKKK